MADKTHSPPITRIVVKAVGASSVTWSSPLGHGATVTFEVKR